jgi:hypothetical protein
VAGLYALTYLLGKGRAETWLCCQVALAVVTAPSVRAGLPGLDALAGVAVWAVFSAGVAGSMLVKNVSPQQLFLIIRYLDMISLRRTVEDASAAAAAAAAAGC